MWTPALLLLYVDIASVSIAGESMLNQAWQRDHFIYGALDLHVHSMDVIDTFQQKYLFLFFKMIQIVIVFKFYFATIL